MNLVKYQVMKNSKYRQQLRQSINELDRVCDVSEELFLF